MIHIIINNLTIIKLTKTLATRKLKNSLAILISKYVPSYRCKQHTYDLQLAVTILHNSTVVMNDTILFVEEQNRVIVAGDTFLKNIQQDAILIQNKAQELFLDFKNNPIKKRRLS